MKSIWCSIIFSFLFFTLSIAQKSKEKNFSALIQQLEQEVAKGNKIALRDVGSLLDKKSVASKARTIIRNHCLFLEDELDLNQKFSKASFLNFFYTYEDSIHFFDPAGVFCFSALDLEKITYEIHPLPRNFQSQKTVDLRRFINSLEKNLRRKDEKNLRQDLFHIASLNTREARQFLLQFLESQQIQNARLQGKVDLIIIICTALQEHTSLKTLDALLTTMQQGYLPFEKAIKILAHLTNHFPEEQKVPQTIEFYRSLVDSLETFENIRYAGYEKKFDFSKYLFPHPVDYYGRIASLTDDAPWMKKNALRDLMETEHPRALLYLASDFYTNYKSTHFLDEKNPNAALSAEEYKNLFLNYTQLTINILDDKNELVSLFQNSDKNAFSNKILKRNFLLYWITHHHDFSWNESYNLFTNKFEVLAKTENYEKLFRRLNSSNDEVAMQSFMQLTEGTPAEILSLSDKYKQLLRTYNKTLPSIRNLFLEQLALLTDFCRNNNIAYNPSENLKVKLDQLKEKLTPPERFQLENRIINSLELSEVTALEYYACLYENNNEFTFSIGRILDHFYSTHWDLVLNNDTQLRLYLKKSVLFKRIGTIGSCNAYLNKFESEDSYVRTRLQEILEVEPDDDIIYLIEFLLPKEKVTEENALDEFLEDPRDFSKNDIRVLPVPTTADLQKTIDLLQKEEDIASIKK